MNGTWHRFAAFLLLLASTGAGALVLAQDAGPGAAGGRQDAAPPGVGAVEGLIPRAGGGERLEFVEGLRRFQDVRTLLEMIAGIMLATFLAAAIAYHPKAYGKASRLDEIEQPKTFLMYAMVAAVCAKIVEEVPEMALVVFGIGGLMRFRTDVGAAKDTGRVILVTMIGLACGLNLLQLAVVAAALGWILVFFLERHVTYRLVVKGLEKDTISEAAQAYQAILLEEDCRVVGEKKNFVKGQVAFVFHAPSWVTREDLEEVLEERISDELRGALDWETT
jgi:hypothetical protein